MTQQSDAQTTIIWIITSFFVCIIAWLHHIHTAKYGLKKYQLPFSVHHLIISISTCISGVFGVLLNNAICWMHLLNVIQYTEVSLHIVMHVHMSI